MLIRKENKIMKKETLKFGTTKNSLRWLELMNYCVNIDSESEARSFFRDVEKTAKDLGFVLSDGREFSARDAVHDWKIVEKKVDEWVEDLIRENGEDVEGLPNIGLIYRNYGDRLVLGIHDGVGGFDEMSEWEFVNKK